MIEMIERAHLSQSSQEFKKAEVFKGDSQYSALLEYLQSESPAPLLVGLNLEHAVVIDTSKSPIEQANRPGWYYIALYDPNAPCSSSNLPNPEWWYEQDPSYLLLNTTNGEWQYWRDGKCRNYMTYYCLGSLQNIQFYDVSLLEESYFVNPLKLWGNLITISFSTANLCVEDINGEVLFQVQDNTITNIANDCEFSPIYSGTTETLQGTITIPNQSFKYTSNSANISVFSDSFLASLSNTGEVNASINLGSKIISVSSNKTSEFTMIMQNKALNNDYAAIGVTTTLEKSGVSLNVNDWSNSKISSSSPDSVVDIQLDTQSTGIKSYSDVTISNIDYLNVENADLYLQRVVPASSISLDKTVVVLNTIGETKMLTATIAPDNATNKAVSWTSSNPAVATVDGNGVVTAISNGTTTIIATSADSGYTAICKVTVISSSGTDGSSFGESSSNSSTSFANYDVFVSPDIDNGTVTVSPRKAFKGTTVTIITKPADGYELEELTVSDDSGNKLTLTDKGNNKYTFTMPSGQVNVDATFVRIKETAPQIIFQDVAAGTYYYDAVLWAVEQGITSGVTATTFNPNGSCTRAQIVTFLWRANGSPAPQTSMNPFTDISPDAYYYDAVLWAVEQGITSGTTPTSFNPDKACTRAQAVTFLWRSEGSPAADNSSFNDVSDGTYYADAVDWAVANNVTQGITSSTFVPSNTCTRAQIVTFLYRTLV